MKLARVIVILVGVLAPGAGVAGASPDAVWEPAKVEVEVAAGGQATVIASVRIGRSFEHLQIRVVPELAGLISVSPEDLHDVEGGDSHELTLTIRVPSDAEAASIDGTLQLRDGKRGLARPLPVILAVVPSGLPPDPGPENDLTLQGIDSDGDGVRDDLQRYIALNYSEPGQVAALRQLAKSFQLAMQVGATSDSAAIEDASWGVTAAVDCMFAWFGTDDTAQIELRIRARNTELRVEADRAFSRMVHGKVLPSTGDDFASACE